MLQVRLDGSNYIARLTIDRKSLVVFAGFIWSEDRKRWETSNHRAAYRLYDYADEETQAHIRNALRLHFSDESLEIKYSKRRVPFYHQIQGARFILQRRASYIAYEAGLGKTLLAPLCLNTSPGKMLVICPSFLKLNWEDEIELGATDFHHIQILRSLSDVVNQNADIHIVPDSLLYYHDFREQFFKGLHYKYVFIDEAHRYKDPDARRTMSLLGARTVKIGKGKEKREVSWRGFHHIADHIIAMSGTPMPNRPIELYTIPSRHAKHAVNYLDKVRFGIRYCGGHMADYGWDFSGASNLDELNAVLCRDYMTVKKLRECVDMPKRHLAKIVFIDDERSAALAAEEFQALKKIKIADIIKYETMRSERFKTSVEDKLEDSPEMGVFGFISELRKMLGLRKVKPSLAIARELLDEHDKIVIGCWHKEVVDEVVKGLSKYNPLFIHGDIKDEERHRRVKAFQTSDKHRVFIGTIPAMGVGLTLTRASVALIIEPSWVPGENEQFIGRIDRLTQTKEVRPYYAVVKNSLDHLILNAHITKTENINATIKSQ